MRELARRPNPNGQWGLNRGQIKKQSKPPARFPLSVIFLSQCILVEPASGRTDIPWRVGAEESVAAN